MKSLFVGVIAVFLFGFSTHAHAQAAKGGWYVGLGLGLTTSEQGDMNILQSRANVRDGGITAAPLKNGYEFSGELGRRIASSMFAIVFRPSYFTQKSTGTGASGDYEYALSGMTFFPMLRLYPLESTFMRFYMQFGLGYGTSNGSIKEGSAQVQFAGSAFGTLYGLGTEFQFGQYHCIGLEGTYRYLNFERNLSNSSSGTFASDSLTQYQNGREVEVDNQDLKTYFTGLQFSLRYNYYF